MGLSHSPRIVTDGLVMALDAANVKSYSGTELWTDLSGNSNNGTLTNGPTFSSLNGGSIIFDGTNDHTEISSSNDFAYGTGDFTWEVWIYVNSFSGNRYLLDHGSNGGTISNGGSGNTKFHYFNTTTGTGSVLFTTGFGTSLSTSTWYHLVAVRKNGTTSLYTNGVLTASASDSHNYGAQVLNIGRYGAGGFPFSGKISNVKIYKGKGLTAAEVAQNYNAIKERYAFKPTLVQDGLVLNLDAGDTNSYPGSGTTWTDLSSNSNNGTLTNGPTYSSADGGSIVFDGTDDYVSETSGLSDSFLQGDWTISFWVNFDAITNSSTSGRILLQHGTNSTRRGLHLEQRNSRVMIGLYSDDLGGSQTLSASTWYNITFTLNNTTRLQQIFIDGSLDNSRTANGAYVGTGSNTRIGGRVLSFSSYLDGKISNVVAYNRVLSAQEISQNYNILKDRY